MKKIIYLLVFSSFTNLKPTIEGVDNIESIIGSLEKFHTNIIGIKEDHSSYNGPDVNKLNALSKNNALPNLSSINKKNIKFFAKIDIGIGSYWYSFEDQSDVETIQMLCNNLQSGNIEWYYIDLLNLNDASVL